MKLLISEINLAYKVLYYYLTKIVQINEVTNEGLVFESLKNNLQRSRKN